MANQESHSRWDLVIEPKKGLFDIPLRALWRYRDLLYMLIKRDFVVIYKQTVLGPIWFFVQPILTVGVYIVVFSRIARISTDGLPPILFYLAGIVIWSYLQDSLNTTSRTFFDNANMFGKVYFPRLILPVAKVISGLIRFIIQFILFLGFYFYYQFQGYDFNANITIVLVPAMILIMAMLGLGLGLFFSSVTAKYRDLVFLIQFGVQLLMYATPVIYPLSAVPEKYKAIILANPMTSIFEGFRYAFLGVGSFSFSSLAVSFLVSAVILLIGLATFNRSEKDFMDTV